MAEQEANERVGKAGLAFSYRMAEKYHAGTRSRRFTELLPRFPYPVPFKEMARFAVTTFAEILRVPHPAFLQYEAFDDADRTLAFPMLGLKARRESRTEEDKGSVAAKLLETLRQFTEIDDLDYDENGDISVCFGSAVILARVVDDPVFARFYSPMLSDIEASPVLLEVLNDLSANMPFTRFVHRNDTIYGVVDAWFNPTFRSMSWPLFGSLRPSPMGWMICCSSNLAVGRRSPN